MEDSPNNSVCPPLLPLYSHSFLSFYSTTPLLCYHLTLVAVMDSKLLSSILLGLIVSTPLNYLVLSFSTLSPLFLFPVLLLAWINLSSIRLDSPSTYFALVIQGNGDSALGIPTKNTGFDFTNSIHFFVFILYFFLFDLTFFIFCY